MLKFISHFYLEADEMLSSTPFVLIMQSNAWISHICIETWYVTCWAESVFLMKASHLQNYLPQQLETSEYCCLNFMQFVTWISYQPCFCLVLDCPDYTLSTTFLSCSQGLQHYFYLCNTCSSEIHGNLQGRSAPFLSFVYFFCFLSLSSFFFCGMSCAQQLWWKRGFPQAALFLVSGHSSLLG